MQLNAILTFMDSKQIKKIRMELDLNQADFAQLIGVSKRSVANYESGDTEPNQRTLLRLVSLEHKIVESKHYEKDAMAYINEKKKKQKKYKIEHSESLLKEEEFNNEGVPYYNLDFTASFLEIENNQKTKPDSYIVHPFFEGCDYVVRASGQSMAKVIKHGDAIGLIKIDDWMDFLPLGEIYAIVTKNGFRMIKIITQGEDDKRFTLISKPTDNKKNEFPPQQLEKNKILSIFKVQASSHLF